MSDAGAIHFKLRKDARDMRSFATTFRILAEQGGNVTVPAATLLGLAVSIEKAATGVALVAEAVALGKELEAG